jgi:uncharacterized protein (DUF1330 family)
MQPKFTVTLAAVAGILLGGGTIESLHAQKNAPVYFVSIKKITDPAGYRKEYAPLAQASIKSHGGRILAAGNPTAIAGAPLKARVVILSWVNMADLREWFDSDDYKKIQLVGEKFSQPLHYLAIPGAAN